MELLLFKKYTEYPKQLAGKHDNTQNLFDT